jgi:hypothetical protein
VTTSRDFREPDPTELLKQIETLRSELKQTKEELKETRNIAAREHVKDRRWITVLVIAAVVLFIAFMNARSSAIDARRESAAHLKTVETLREIDSQQSDAILRQLDKATDTYGEVYKNPGRWIQAYYWRGALDALHFSLAPTGEPQSVEMVGDEYYPTDWVVDYPRFRWIDFPWGNRKGNAESSPSP